MLDEAAPEADIDAAFESTFHAVAARSSAGLSRLLGRFADLVMSGGVLDDLRFDDHAFGMVIERALPSLGRSRRARRRERLFEIAIPELAERQAVHRFRARLRRAMEAAALEPAHREGVVAALMCLAPTIDRAAPPADSPTLEIIFNVQLEEWIDRREALRKVFDDTSQRVRDGDIGLDEMETVVRRAVATDPTVVASLLDPEGTAQAIDRATERVVRTLRARRAPALFTAAETLFLANATRTEIACIYRAQGASEGDQQTAVQALLRKLNEVFDGELAHEVTGRIISDRVRGRADSNSRFLQDFVGALTGDPALVGPLAFLSTLGRIAVRDDVEQEHVDRLAGRERWNAADIEPYCHYLQAAGDAVGLRLVRRVLDDLPPDGLAGGLFAATRRARRSKRSDARAGTQLDLLGDAGPPPTD